MLKFAVHAFNPNDGV